MPIEAYDREVEAELERGLLKCICAWCKEVMREGAEPATHSICEQCREKISPRRT